MRKGADSELPGWQPKETASQLPQERGTLETAWVASVRKREGAQRPRCPQGTQGPWRRGATGCCRLSRQLLACDGRARLEHLPRFRHRSSPELNDDITRATDVMIVGKRALLCLSVVLLVVCCFPNVTPSAPCRRAEKVSRSRPSCLRSTSLFPQRVSPSPQEEVEEQCARRKHWTLQQRDRLGWLRGLGRHDSRQHQASRGPFRLPHIHRVIVLASGRLLKWTAPLASFLLGADAA